MDGTVKVETYIGVSAPPWKQRYRNHINSFSNKNKKGETMLSTHIWDIKERGTKYTVSWKIVDKGNPYTPVTSNCNLCTKEKFYILRRPDMSSLNQRQEVGSYCRHIRMSLLSNVEKVLIPNG